MKVECPHCHSLFRVVTESKELVEDNPEEDFREGVKGKVEEALDDIIPTGPPGIGIGGRAPGSFGKDVDDEDQLYEYKFKCKHCGYEWTEYKDVEKVDK